jgi:hypothetical protein
LPPALLLYEQVQYLEGHEFYNALRKFFIQKDSFNFGQNQSSARLSHGTSANHVMLHVAREFYKAAILDDFTDDSYKLTNMFLRRLQKNSAEIPIANVPQLNQSSSQSSDPDEEFRKRSSALPAAFQEPQRQFGGNIHEDYAEVLDSYSRLAERQCLDLDFKTKLFYKAFRDGALTYNKQTVEKMYPDFASRIAAQ